jgi:sugar (pentulose or hexulose) kinase
MLTCVLNLGLKSMRAVVFDERGTRLAIAYRPIESRMGEGRVEQDPDEWWDAGLSVLDEVLAGTGLAERVGIVTTTASAGCLVLLDGAGKVVRPAIMISDVRAREQARAIQAMPEFAALGLGGAQVTPDLMLPKIAWLREHEPAVHDATRWFASPNDFLVQRLTGCLVTDPANASKYFHGGDPEAYPGDLVRALGIDEERLPPVVRGGDGVLALEPRLRDRLGLRPETLVVLSTYDAICAVYGSGVGEVGDACDVSGTVTSFRAVTDRRDPDPSGRLFVTPHVGAGRYLAGGSNNLGGGVIEWAKQVLYPDDPDPYAAMEREASESPPGAAGLTFLPYLLGERAPVWDPLARAVFFGLGRNHGRSDMIRAIFEGVGYSVLDIADRLAGMAVPVQRVWASGGLARVGPISQIKADMLGVPVCLTEELETTALGAALVAGVNAGLHESIEAAIESAVRPAGRFEPVEARTRMYRDFFAVYRELYERLQPLYSTRERLIAEHSEVLRTTLTRTENL